MVGNPSSFWSLRASFTNEGQIASQLNLGYFLPTVKSNLCFTNKTISCAQLADCVVNLLSDTANGWEMWSLMMSQEVCRILHMYLSPNFMNEHMPETLRVSQGKAVARRAVLVAQDWQPMSRDWWPLQLRNFTSRPRTQATVCSVFTEKWTGNNV